VIYVIQNKKLSVITGIIFAIKRILNLEDNIKNLVGKINHLKKYPIEEIKDG
jgi:hypothetical protein